MELTTDAIIDISEHIRRETPDIAEFLAGKGLNYETFLRVRAMLAPKGEGSWDAFTEGIAIGLQIGTMRLDPIEYNPEEKPPCNCIMCTITRAIEENED